MKRISSLLLFTVIILTSISCLHKADLSSLKEVSFASDIQPILAANCTQSNCHNVGGREFSLVTYNDVMSGGEIKAGDAHGSNLYQTISNHGFAETMPPSPLPPLSTDQIKLIYLWIEQGAKNN